MAALLALATLVGLPLALAAMTLYAALLVVGYAAAGGALGQLALTRWQPARASHAGWRFAAAFVGALAVSLLARLPWVGALVVLAALLLGVGGLLLQARATAQ